MPEEVTIRKDLQVIQVKSRGDITAEDFENSLDAILRIRQHQGLTKVFVDASDVTSYPSTTTIYTFGSEAAEPLKGMKIAIASALEKRDDPDFFETVTRNRGAVVKVFDSPDAALAWLTKKPNKMLHATP